MNSGDTAWVLVSTALVMLMTPGVALFYGGMVRAKSVLNMMMMSFGALAVVGVLWMLYGYSMSFGPDVGAGLLGNPFTHFGLGDINYDDVTGTIPTFVFVGFQAMFAIITVALVSGAIADRAKFWSWMLFAALWATIVYFPVAHWVFDFADGAGGWVGDRLGAIDFAGGTAVHINAGAAGLALAIVLGPRRDFAKGAHRPHNLPLVMLGAGLLWFGWFGFNAGSALAANGVAGITLINTVIATSAASLSWICFEKVRDGHATSLGAASGVVAGLVAITPACSALSPLGSLILGVVVGVVCAIAIDWKFRLGFDDSLDVVAVHMVGGLVGTIGVGFLATDSAPAGVSGLLSGGGLDQLGKQVVAAFAVLVFSFVVSYLLGLAIQKTIGFRVDDDHEVTGVDVTLHAESGYDLFELPSERESVMARVAAAIDTASVRATSPAALRTAGEASA